MNLLANSMLAFSESPWVVIETEAHGRVIRAANGDEVGCSLPIFREGKYQQAISENNESLMCQTPNMYKALKHVQRELNNLATGKVPVFGYDIAGLLKEVETTLSRISEKQTELDNL